VFCTLYYTAVKFGEFAITALVDVSVGSPLLISTGAGIFIYNNSVTSIYSGGHFHRTRFHF
jgi:hypothetical protein